MRKFTLICQLLHMLDFMSTYFYKRLCMLLYSKRLIPNFLYLILQLGWVLITKYTSLHYLVSTGIQALASIYWRQSNKIINCKPVFVSVISIETHHITIVSHLIEKCLILQGVKIRLSGIGTPWSGDIPLAADKGRRNCVLIRVPTKEKGHCTTVW